MRHDTPLETKWQSSLGSTWRNWPDMPSFFRALLLHKNFSRLWHHRRGGRKAACEVAAWRPRHLGKADYCHDRHIRPPGAVSEIGNLGVTIVRTILYASKNSGADVRTEQCIAEDTPIKNTRFYLKSLLRSTTLTHKAMVSPDTTVRACSKLSV